MLATHQIISQHPVENLVISGASITDSPWYTWADFLIESTGLPCQNFSSRGAGNEFIVASLIKNHHKITKNSLVVVMLTSVDKFDWYVEDYRFQRLQKEKHRPKPISDHTGFWCTGSWFPEEKAQFKDTFYSYDYFCVKSLQQIVILNSLCHSKQCSLLILFDSPIWQYSEQTILKIAKENLDPYQCKYEDDLPYFDLWKPGFDPNIINNFEHSLIGHCWINKLPWWNALKLHHPPSSSHYKYFDAVIKPALTNIVAMTSLSFLDTKIKKFDQLWISNNQTIDVA